MIKILKAKLRNSEILYYFFKGISVYALILFSYVILMFSFFLPIKKKQILFRAYEGRGYSCNPKAITEYLLEKQAGYHIIWAFKRPEDYGFLVDKGISLVKVYSVKYYYYYLTSSILVFNDFWSSFIKTRKGQVFLNTWHGSGALKCVGLCTMPKRIDKLLYRMRHDYGFMISGCKKFTDIIDVSFGNKLSYLEFGLPRNDIFFVAPDKKESIRNKVYSHFNLPANKNIVLYAPTYRESFAKELYGLNTLDLVNTLSKRFGGEWIVLVRTHYFIADEKIMDQNILDASGYSDMQELLISSEVLITDYSSCSWDFSLQNKPCFLYIPDLEEYQKDFSFYNPISTLPYDKAITNFDLVNNIMNFDKNKYQTKLTNFYKEFGSFDNGTSLLNIYNFFFNNKN